MYVLILVTTSTIWLGMNDTKVSEFSSKDSCEVALSLAKDEWSTIDKESHCVSVEEYKKKIDMKSELDALKKKMRDLNQ